MKGRAHPVGLWHAKGWKHTLHMAVHAKVMPNRYNADCKMGTARAYGLPYKIYHVGFAIIDLTLYCHILIVAFGTKSVSRGSFMAPETYQRRLSYGTRNLTAEVDTLKRQPHDVLGQVHGTQLDNAAPKKVLKQQERIPTASTPQHAAAAITSMAGFFSFKKHAHSADHHTRHRTPCKGSFSPRAQTA